MKIGIMGGTFDPIHSGHVMLAEYAYQQCHLDEVWFMPNGNPPHKKNSTSESDAHQRAEMVGLAIADVEYFKLNLYEVNQKNVSCSYQTLEYLKSSYPKDEFYFIIGADSLFAIETWVHPERIFPTCTILAACRDAIDTYEEMNIKIQELKKKYNARIILLKMPLFHVSSHEIRSFLKEGKDVSGYIPEDVEHYIQKYGLYKEG